MENLKPEEIRKVWRYILQDTDAKRALRQLKKDGFGFSHMSPEGATFKRPNWAFHIAAIPLLSNRPSRRRIFSLAALRKHRPLVSVLRQLAEEVNDPFCDVSIMSATDCSIDEILKFGNRLCETAEFLEKFLSWNWYTRHRNPRNAVIAELRWQIRERTGRPHDSELGVLIDASFRAAGVEKGFYIDATAFDRLEKREKEGRVKASRRLRSLATVAVQSKPNGSTRFRQNPRKRV